MPPRPVKYMNTTDPKAEAVKLLQSARIHTVKYPAEFTFVCVYASESLTDGFHRYAFLLPVGETESFLENVSWDYRDDDLLPHVDYVQYTKQEEWVRDVYYLGY